MKKKYSVGSLYAGIGGICLGFQKAGAQVLWANEYDANACKTYRNNFEHRLIEGDVHDLSPADVPAVDILTSGFPCQAFSVAGYRKGFDDERGLHFFQTMKFVDVLKPVAFLFENVKNLVSHDGGRTFQRIKKEIAARGYSFVPMVLNTKDYGNVPQTRERIYMVGFRDESPLAELDPKSATAYFLANKPQKKKLTVSIRQLLDRKVDDKYYYDRFPIYKYLMKEMKSRDTLYQWRRVYVRENKSNVCPTLTANMGTGGHNVPLVLDGKGVRKLTPGECARFQGFKDGDLTFPKGMSDSHLYKQIGNSVSVPVVYELAKAIIHALNHKRISMKSGLSAKSKKPLIAKA